VTQRSSYSLDLLDAEANWRTHAVCQNHPADWWWNPDHYRDALHQCRLHCPVTAQCKQWADGFQWRDCVVAGEVWVWGKGKQHYGKPSPKDHPSSTRLCTECRGTR
jgi:hypothetical protein